MVFIAENRNREIDPGFAVRAGLGFGVLELPARVRSFCDNLAGFLAQSARMSHSLVSRFSACCCAALARLWALSDNQFVQLDVETPAWHRLSIRIIRRCRTRLEDERPQLGKILTTIVKIGEAVPAEDSLTDPVSSPGQSSAKAGSEPSAVHAGVIAISRGRNFVRQIPLCRIAIYPMMAADEIERANEATVASAIAQAAFDPVLAIAKELQDQVEDFDGFGWVARAHEITSPHPR
jgi:hypothetical protein